ncbi:MAG: hypothetical protein HY539_02615 [Deltaproteobacteria bacterium]|nr:hypothetical protein [Deltaproteobacteria bacterium]
MIPTAHRIARFALLKQRQAVHRVALDPAPPVLLSLAPVDWMTEPNFA